LFLASLHQTIGRLVGQVWISKGAQAMNLEHIKKVLAEYKARPWYQDSLDWWIIFYHQVKSLGIRKAIAWMWMLRRHEQRMRLEAKARIDRFASSHGYVKVNGKWVKPS
jgi:hypothetical protein